jgi:hypothetical protein
MLARSHGGTHGRVLIFSTELDGIAGRRSLEETESRAAPILVALAKAHGSPGKLPVGCHDNLIHIPVERRGLRLKRKQVTDSEGFSKLKVLIH